MLGALALALTADQIARLDTASAVPLGVPHDQLAAMAPKIAGGGARTIVAPAVPVG